MTPQNPEVKSENRGRTAAWFGAAVGAGIGIAALAYSRRRRSRWDIARDRAGKLLQTARKQVKPWMGAAAGTAAAGTAVACYMVKPKESGWQRAGKRAGDMASRIGTQGVGPWANLAATAAISLASVAYANRARRGAIRGIDASTANKINAITERGLGVLRRARAAMA
jgi:hypothetical protein